MSIDELQQTSDTPPTLSTVQDVRARMIDRWFPCGPVDAAVKTPAGSGLSEKALFTWFASRPIAQARAAVLTTLLPDREDLRPAVVELVSSGSREARDTIEAVLAEEYPAGRPVVLDVFSGRGIIPLEAARLGVTAVGTDLSPVATLAGRLLGDYPMRHWSGEPRLPFAAETSSDASLFGEDAPRLLSDVASLFAEVGRRAATEVAELYPVNSAGEHPWAYLWALSIPCDQCKRRFPLIGSMSLRHPYARTDDPGQALYLIVDDDTWRSEVKDGLPVQEPSFAAPVGRKGKIARCVFCKHTHPLDAVKAKGANGEFTDVLIAVADGGETPRKVFRAPSQADFAVLGKLSALQFGRVGDLTEVPDEPIPPGNQDTIRASGYGFRTYGALMNARQTAYTVALVRAIRSSHSDMLRVGVGSDYASALTGFAAGTLVRKLRRSTRGARLNRHGKPDGSKQNRLDCDHIFADESKVAFNLDYLETGPGAGPGTWGSIASTGLKTLEKVITESGSGRSGRFRRASAVALPFRDNSVDAVITDPPYYNMIDYADASDLFYVWLKRALFDVMPDLFGADGLQDKTDEIIIKRGNAPGEHRTREFYESMLSRAFTEAKRVLRPDGHLVVVFGHSDPDAWLRLLGALRDAGFVVTSSWPSRTEAANTGVASIKVTVAIGCRVAAPQRPVATAAQVDREVTTTVKAAVRQWDADGLALGDQLMAAYGPAMEVYGRYSSVLLPNGEQADLDRYLTLARASVRDATALKLDELPLETFDAPTRFAVFWQRLYGRTDVPKGEARFLAQVDNLRLEELRGALLTESKSGFKLRLDASNGVSERSSTFEVARAMAKAWDDGGTEAVASVMAVADRQANDAHLWAVVAEIVRQLPASDPVAKALTAVQRNAGTIGTMIEYVAAAVAVETDARAQLTLSFGEDQA
ncbi:MAG: Adenine-specific methylase containing a Zn-ribbon-like protein [Frankiales bacterium]|nr:Adenine-specific methylase containing a Zn-ribbon-like protein [Frankiales bacterium]